ncbi:unnamed protein product [Brugia pahangi]|uniref:Uncharacterized protein n=1 Tax=Brugia pahangi TaxID=6280 RepID=A0A0N4TSF0_BRUPA|nr:unnamed protein product [Brugia pahangi]
MRRDSTGQRCWMKQERSDFIVLRTEEILRPFNVLLDPKHPVLIKNHTEKCRTANIGVDTRFTDSRSSISGTNGPDEERIFLVTIRVESLWTRP